MKDAVSVTLETRAKGVGFLFHDAIASPVARRSARREVRVEEILVRFARDESVGGDWCGLNCRDGVCVSADDIIGDESRHGGGPLPVSFRGVFDVHALHHARRP